MNIMNIQSFARSKETTEQWLRDLQKHLNLRDEEEAFVVLRAVLHTLRDRLSVNEAVDFGAQLPLLIAGVYYNGWSPNKKPVRIKSKDEFINRISQTLPQGQDPLEATKATLDVLKHQVTEGEMSDVRSEMPKEIEELWAA